MPLPSSAFIAHESSHISSLWSFHACLHLHQINGFLAGREDGSALKARTSSLSLLNPRTCSHKNKYIPLPLKGFSGMEITIG